MTTNTDNVEEYNRQLIIRHFDELINHKDLDAITRNLSEDFYDHVGPEGTAGDRASEVEFIRRLHAAMPDLHVDVLDCLADADKVAVRNVWTGTPTHTRRRIEFH